MFMSNLSVGGFGLFSQTANVLRHRRTQQAFFLYTIRFVSFAIAFLFLSRARFGRGWGWKVGVWFILSMWIHVCSMIYCVYV